MVETLQIPAVPISDGRTQAIIAPVQSTLVASKAYAVGEYFIFNGGMYVVTTAIASGASIVIGTASGCNAAPSDTVMESVGIIRYRITGVTNTSNTYLTGTESYHAYLAILLCNGYTSIYTIIRGTTGTPLVRATIFEGTQTNAPRLTADASNFIVRLNSQTTSGNVYVTLIELYDGEKYQ